MEFIERAAMVSVSRGCGFGGLAIFCFMVGLSPHPQISTTTGGVLCIFMAAVLVLLAFQARSYPYKRTEVWLLLAEEHRPPSPVAQKLIGTVLRDTCLRFAQHALVFAMALLTLSTVIRFLR
ncbi:MAG: hypothetical protein NW205_12030 [Hyphomicrobiaceae bacterium]|nr:hypothetical protein [Hyphomicrobiaceae bacterium]